MAINAVLVDPSLFTAPYDAALNAGLNHAGVTTLWATRGLRNGEARDLPEAQTAPIFYPGLEASAKKAGALAKLRKAMSHVGSTKRLIKLAQDWPADIVHFQWSVLPAADLRAIRKLRDRAPVVLTVHDTTPFNGNPTSKLQVVGFPQVLAEVDHVIVHTSRGQAALIEAGCPQDKLSVIPHGPFTLDLSAAKAPKKRDPRWTCVLFGRLQDYKGVDVLIDALASLPPEARDTLRIIIAGEPFCDLTQPQAKAERANLNVDWRLGWLSDAQMADLMLEADTLLFPYRRIEASGVYYLTKGLGKWIIASDLGAFGDEVTPDMGQLVPPGDAPALAQALSQSVGKTPAKGALGTDWPEIGQRTAALYKRLAG